MSPRPADPAVRTALIEAAADLLVEHGPDALTTRRLAAEVGTSTMAVYTHFRGMEDLRRAVAAEGFERLASYLDAVRRTDDPVADLAVSGAAYFFNAVANPRLYRFMFLERAPGDDSYVGHETFDRLVVRVARSVEEGRFAPGDSTLLAAQLWSVAHGIVTLHLAGIFSIDEAILYFYESGFNLFVAFGDDRDAARRSLERATHRLEQGEIGAIPPGGAQAPGLVADDGLVASLRSSETRDGAAPQPRTPRDSSPEPPRSSS